jgi:hypothetical protein
MRRYAVFIALVVLVEVAQGLLWARYLGPASNLAEGLTIFCVVPVALSVLAYRWLALPASRPAWRVAHYAGILLAPLAAAALAVVFLFTLCNIAVFGICAFP